jgi:sugar (pentulose or hexulose) kinase
MGRFTKRKDMLVSVMEGASFSIKQMMEIVHNFGIKPKEIFLAEGGG